jgi:c(7)-type cytochrome triheme protein
LSTVHVERRLRYAGLSAVLAVLVGAPLPAAGPSWKPLAEDDLHAVDNPALQLLQEPSEALSTLPGDGAGNQVRWVKALRDGYISPRTNILPETEVQVLDLDVLMPRTGEMPIVLFPHLPHTEWLDCENCHDRIFARTAGATPVNMFKILQGEYCGQCHGAVAFPLTECARCHSVPRKNLIR